MSRRGKARVAVVLLALLALWPPLHHRVVTRYQIDPWRLYGFAMYCAPSTDVSIRFFAEAEQGRRALPMHTLESAVERELVRFRRRHRTFRTHAPDAVARAVRRHNPHLRDLVIRVETLHYDLGRARFVHRSDEYRYPAAPRHPS